jgi:capsular exopolysaccharide synthesis family protein
MQIADNLNGNWRLATEVHKLEARLWRRVQRDHLSVILFTSAVRGEGKSTTVAYLAAAMGLYPSRRVLAVDLDFRVPSLGRHFPLDASKSIGAVLRGECSLDIAIQKTELPNLDLICPLPEGEDPSLLMKTPELHEIFRQLRSSYDLILVDTPALLPVADTSNLLWVADGVIFLGMAGKTTKHELTKARDICLGMDANIMGLVISNVEETSGRHGQYGYDYASGYGYHRGYGEDKTAEKTDGPAQG